MATLEYVYADTMLVLDDRVLEMFNRVVSGSQRTPLIWAGVQLVPKK